MLNPACDRRTTVCDVGPPSPDQAAVDRHDGGDAARRPARRHRSDHRRHRGTAHHRIAVRIRSLPMGRDDLSAVVDRGRADLREPVRSLRPQAVLHERRDPVRAGIGVVRRRRQPDVPAVRRHGTADRLPRIAGHRRRHDYRRAVHDRRRHFLAAGARQVSGAVRGGLRPGVDLRAHARRLADRLTGRGAPAST